MKQLNAAGVKIVGKNKTVIICRWYDHQSRKFKRNNQQITRAKKRFKVDAKWSTQNKNQYLSYTTAIIQKEMQEGRDMGTYVYV